MYLSPHRRPTRDGVRRPAYRPPPRAAVSPQDGLRAIDAAFRAGAPAALSSALPVVCSQRLGPDGRRRLGGGGALKVLEVAMLALYNLCMGGAHEGSCEALVRAGALEAMAAAANNGPYREARSAQDRPIRSVAWRAPPSALGRFSRCEHMKNRRTLLAQTRNLLHRQLDLAAGMAEPALPLSARADVCWPNDCPHRNFCPSTFPPAACRTWERSC